MRFLRGSVLLLCACGAAQRPSAAARAGVEAIVAEQLDALRRGDSDALMAHADPDGFMMGIIHSRVTPDFLVELHKAIDPMVKRGVKIGVQSTGLVIGLTPDGRAAWVSDELQFTVDAGGGRAMNMTQRFTEVLVEHEGRWTIPADHMSLGVGADAQADARTPEEVPERISPDAAPVVAALDALLADPARLAGAIADRDDASWFGSSPEAKLRGAAAIRAHHQEHFGHHEVRLARKGGARAGVAPGGQLAWVTCNVEVAYGDIDQVHRLLVVFLKEPGGWKIVQAHFSLVPGMG